MTKDGFIPPAKKIDQEDIDAVFDRRDELQLPVLTAANVTEILVDSLENVDRLNNETVRNHLDAMANSDEYDIVRWKLGARTVIYGRTGDPDKVVSERRRDLLLKAKALTWKTLGLPKAGGT